MSNLTPKQDKFCHRYVELGDASAAYRDAYSAKDMLPATVNRKAAEMLKNGKITARIAELQNNHRQRHDATIDGLIAELEEARKLALRTGTPAAAVSASSAKAKILGCVIRPRDLPVPIPLNGTLTEQGLQVIESMGKGDVSPSDAASMLSALASQARVTEIDELVKRVAALEAKNAH